MNNPEKNLTIREVAETYNIVYETARTDLMLLVRKRFLSMKKVSKQFMFRLDSNKA